MNPWDTYRNRLNSSGATKREVRLNRACRYLNAKLADNSSYFDVTINETAQSIAVVNTDNLNEKSIYSIPGEDIPAGGLVEWMGNHWLVTNKDASIEPYARAKMTQCNYILKWIDKDHIIRKQWCIVEDGTKYLTGTYVDRDFFLTRGDSRLCITLPRTKYTAKLKRGDRFLIDDAESEVMLAYELTKPFKLNSVYNSEGTFQFVLQEVNTTDYDNQELGIADYYKHFQSGAADTGDVTVPDSDIADDMTDSGRKVWL